MGRLVIAYGYILCMAHGLLCQRVHVLIGVDEEISTASMAPSCGSRLYPVEITCERLYHCLLSRPAGLRVYALVLQSAGLGVAWSLLSWGVPLNPLGNGL